MTVTSNRSRQIDGRWIIVGALALYFGVLCVGSLFVPCHAFWRVMGVDAASPSFADLRVIFAAFDSHRAGTDVWRENAGDPWGRKFNYPRIWLSFARLGIDERHTVIVGIILGAAFFAAVFWLIGPVRVKEGLLYSVLLCSPAVMLAIERGNTDLIVFLVMTVALFLLHRRNTPRFFSFVVMLFAATLKLYPVFGCSIALSYTQKRFWQMAGFGVLAFGVYLAFTFRDLYLISAATPRGLVNAYGSNVGIASFALLLAGMKVLTFDPERQWFHSFAIASAIALALTAIVYTYAKRARPNACVSSESTRVSRAAFRVGTCIYLGTFVLGNNWDYRLIFLICLVPQLLEWSRVEHPQWRAVMFSLALIGIAMNWQLFSNDSEIRFVLINEAVNWVLAADLLYLFLLALPEWARALIGLRVDLRARDDGIRRLSTARQR